MTAILLTALFSASAFLALGTIASAWRRYGPATLALREELANAAEWRAVRVTHREVSLRQSATVLRPAFTRPAGRPSPAAALPAAA